MFNEFMNEILESDDPKKASGQFLRSHRVTHDSVQFDRHGPVEDPPTRLQDLMLKLGKSSGSVSLAGALATMLAGRIVHATENRNLVQDDVEELERLALEADREGSAAEHDRALLDVLRANSTAPADALKSDGSNMARFLFALKNSPDFSSVERYNTIKNRFERLFEDPKLSIEPIEERRIITNETGRSESFQNRRIMIVEKTSSKHLPLEQAGAGVRNVLYLLAAVHGTKESVVMLDEPGINLHPTMLRGVMDNVYEQDQDNQIFVITHSVDLLRYEMSRNSHVAHIGNAGGRSRICQDAYKTIRLKKEPREVAHVIDPAVFFARRVILVEGESDRTMLDIFGRMAAQDPKYNLPLHSIVVASAGGRGGFENYRKLLDECGISWKILADKDAECVFEHDRVSWVCKDGVEGDGPIYLLKGDLEAFLEDLNPTVWEKSLGKQKVATVLKYTRRLLAKDPGTVPAPIVKFLDRCVE